MHNFYAFQRSLTNSKIWFPRFMYLPFSMVHQLMSLLISFLCIFEQFFAVVLSENNTGGTAQKNPHELDFARHNILNAQFECYQKIMRDTNHNKTGERFLFHKDSWLWAMAMNYAQTYRLLDLEQYSESQISIYLLVRPI